MARPRIATFREDDDELEGAGSLPDLVSRLNTDTLDVEDSPDELAPPPPPRPATKAPGMQMLSKPGGSVDVAIGPPSVTRKPAAPPEPPPEPMGATVEAQPHGPGMDSSELHDFPGQGTPAGMPPPPMVQAPKGPGRADRLRQALASDADARRQQGVSDALYSAFSRRPLAPMAQGPSAVQAQAALDEAQGADTKADRDAQLQDPNSEVSKLLRSRFLGLPIGKRFAASMGPDYEKLPGALVPNVQNLLDESWRPSNRENMQPGISGERDAKAELDRARADLIRAKLSGGGGGTDAEREAMVGFLVSKGSKREYVQNLPPDLLRQLVREQSKPTKGGGKGGPVALGPDGKPLPHTMTPNELRQKKWETGTGVRAGWEPIDPNLPTFRTPKQAEDFDDAAAAFDQISNHKAHIEAALARAKDPNLSWDERDAALGEVNAQMGALAGRLVKTEGLNNSDASHEAVDNLLAFHKGSVINPRNLINEKRLPSLLKAAIDSSRTNLDSLAASRNIRRDQGGPAPAGHGATPVASGSVQMKFPDGSVHAVPPEKLELAKQKGGVPLG